MDSRDKQSEKYPITFGLHGFNAEPQLSGKDYPERYQLKDYQLILGQLWITVRDVLFFLTLIEKELDYNINPTGLKLKTEDRRERELMQDLATMGKHTPPPFNPEILEDLKGALKVLEKDLSDIREFPGKEAPDKELIKKAIEYCDVISFHLFQWRRISLEDLSEEESMETYLAFNSLKALTAPIISLGYMMYGYWLAKHESRHTQQKRTNKKTIEMNKRRSEIKVILDERFQGNPTKKQIKEIIPELMMEYKTVEYNPINGAKETTPLGGKTIKNDIEEILSPKNC